MHHTHTPYPSQRPNTALPASEPLVRQKLRPCRQLITAWLVPLSLVLCSLMPMAMADERSGAEGAPATPTGGTLILSNAQGSIEAVQLDANMQVSVSGLLAQMTLTQTFENNSDQWMQARYQFPLPETAAVQSLLVETNGRIIHGRIMPREEARESFEMAKDNGQIAGLVEQQRPNLFTMDVATIAPNSTLSVTMTVMLPVDVDRTSRSITLPTTHTPRYSNQQTIDAVAVTGAFTTGARQRGPRLDLHMSIEGIEQYDAISSDTHVLSTSDSAVSLSDVPMDRDVVIRWPAAYTDSASSEVFLSEHHNERYAQILLNPPAQMNREDKAQRELVIVVDKSGSMAGESMQAARKALEFALDSIDPADYFNIIAFNDQSYPLFAQSRPANATNLRNAFRFINALEADGGTEMRESLRFALRSTAQTSTPLERDIDASATSAYESNSQSMASSTNRLKQVVFVTDGSVGYEDQMLLEIKQRLGASRLFTVGIGSAPNQWFLQKAAEAGRGVSLSIPDSQSAANAIEQLLGRLASPVVTELSVQFMGGRGELYPDPIPDLYADKPRMLVSRLSPDVRQILVSGYQYVDGDIRRWQQRIHVEPVDPDSLTTEQTQVPVAKLFWTRLKVASLLDEQRYSADEDLHKQSITQLALDAQLLTPYTSFVAVDQTPVRPVDTAMNATEVASLVPHGNKMMDLAMPQGAAGVDTLAWLSLLLATGGLLMILFARRSNQVVL